MNGTSCFIHLAKLSFSIQIMWRSFELKVLESPHRNGRMCETCSPRIRIEPEQLRYELFRRNNVN